MSSTTVGESAVCSDKKKRRLEAYLERKSQRRVERKAYKERRKERKRQQSLTSPPPPCPNDGASATGEPKSSSSSRCLMADSACKAKVVIDCAYDHLMTVKDICKLCNQVNHCYALNRRQTNPVQFHITGLKASHRPKAADDQSDSLTITLLEKLKAIDCHKWDVYLHEEDYNELFDSSEVVYLCAESPNLLLPECLTDKRQLPDKSFPGQETNGDQSVYVIGGLVDHNHRLGFCYEQAVGRKHRTGRLPIKEADIQLNGRCVLSVDQVFACLVPVLSGSSCWRDALRDAIPPRKMLLSSKQPNIDGADKVIDEI